MSSNRKARERQWDFFGRTETRAHTVWQCDSDDEMPVNGNVRAMFFKAR